MVFKMSVMKKIFFIALGMALCNVASSQGTMQFNRAVLLNSASTVPVGKVWKVESVLNGTNSTFNNNLVGIECLMSFSVNGTQICVSRFHEFVIGTSLSNSTAASESANNPTNFPIWLPAGTTIDLGKNAAFISILEFIAP